MTAKSTVKQRTVNPANGKAKTRLYFENENSVRSSKLLHTLQDAPLQAVSGAVHREIQQSGQDNVGVESAHKLEEAAERGGRLAAHSLRVQKWNVRRKPPPHPVSSMARRQQKQAVKKQYAAAKRAGQSANQAAKKGEKAVKKAAKGTEKTVRFLWRHKKGVLIVLALFLAAAVIFAGIASCAVLAEGVLSGLGGSTFPSRDGEMLGAEAAYAGLEAGLKNELDHYASLHPGYDEYQFDLDEVGHDPYVLMALLHAYHPGGWTLEAVQGTLELLFERQYAVTEAVTTETRYDGDGEPYAHTICTVKLENFDLSRLPVYLMGEDQLSIYAAYMATLGNRPDLFPVDQYPNASHRQDYLDYDVPPEALEDEVFAAMLAEAKKYLGYPYVWGGSSPATSFDCSGYVSWVLNHSGWSVGRLGAQSLCNLCTPVSTANARPGDLVFFTNTFPCNTPVSHVGIYVGDGMMIHCGSPISYANLNTSYWQAHFYCYGRLPEP